MGVEGIKAFWTYEGLANAFGGELISRPDVEFSSGLNESGGVCIDSRLIEQGSVFVAIRGEQTDGHLFVADATRRGAGVVVVDDASAVDQLGEVERGQAGVVLVEDTRRSLFEAARVYRGLLGDVRVIAVTGSFGKTTTTRLIDAVLSQRMQGVCSIKSFNNDLGVPMTILRVGVEDRYLICEVGSSGVGEVEKLSRLVRPDYAVVTGVGAAHVVGLGGEKGGLEGIAAEKASLSRGLVDGGVLIFNADSELLCRAIDGGVRSLSFGQSDKADCRLQRVQEDESGVCFGVEGFGEMRLTMLGGHNATNALAAVLTGDILGLTAEEIRAGLEMARGEAMRLEREVVGGVTVINDAYNANPESTKAAIQTVESLAKPGEFQRVVVVLGDMLELGEGSLVEHELVGARLGLSAFVTDVVTVGVEAKWAGMVAAKRLGDERVVHMDSVQGLGASEVAERLQIGDLVLLKGSRAMELERVVLALKERVRAAEVAVCTRDPQAVHSVCVQKEPLQD